MTDLPFKPGDAAYCVDAPGPDPAFKWNLTQDRAYRVIRCWPAEANATPPIKAWVQVQADDGKPANFDAGRFRLQLEGTAPVAAVSAAHMPPPTTGMSPPPPRPLQPATEEEG